MSEDEVRARIAHAVSLHGTATASLNPDGSVDVRVPTNDLEVARRKRAERGKKWRGVTNELVTSHADPHCKECKGTGENEIETVCSCAEVLFEIAYRGRLRWNQKRARLEVFV